MSIGMHSLREQMKDLPEPPNDSHPPLWAYWRHGLWQAIVDGKNPADFKGFPCVYHTMLWRHRPDAIDVEHKALKPHYVNAAKIDFGSPPDIIHGTDLGENMVHQVYHAMRYEQETGKRIDELKSVVEFGGGYGAMAVAFYRLGFRGKYYIVDLPEFSLLQQYYLDKVGVPIVHNPKTVKPDLFIASYSLSEVPVEERDGTLEWYKAKSYLFLYSNKFAGYDNMAYFSTPPSHVKNWKYEQIAHLPQGNWYAWGW